MKRNMKTNISVTAACAAAAAFALGAAGGDTPGGRLLAEAPRISRILARQMPAAHVRHHSFDAALAPAVKFAHTRAHVDLRATTSLGAFVYESSKRIVSFSMTMLAPSVPVGSAAGGSTVSVATLPAAVK